jgi:hypothetical protein
MEVSGQLHAPAALPPRKDLLVPMILSIKTKQLATLCQISRRLTYFISDLLVGLMIEEVVNCLSVYSVETDVLEPKSRLPHKCRNVLILSALFVPFRSRTLALKSLQLKRPSWMIFEIQEKWLFPYMAPTVMGRLLGLSGLGWLKGIYRT